jgi:hypothetical protein
VRPLRDPPGVDPSTRRVLDDAEGDDHGRRVDRVDEILREVSVGAVVDEPKGDPATLGGREPRVRHAGEIRSDEEDGSVVGVEQRGHLAQTLARARDDGHRIG